MINQVCDKELCTGCSACMNACPTKAITMTEGEIGHIFPTINDNCIECNRCVRTCPVNSKVVLNTPMKVYAAWAKDNQEHQTSTSGGAAACFTNKILANEGAVYGCSSLPHGEIKHIRVTTSAEAHLLKGSKYVQSHIGEVYRQIAQDLKADKKVLFIGLPCQVAGLKNFIGKEPTNLITVDLICHGVPSQKILFDYLQAKGINKQLIDSVRFREQGGCFLSVRENNKVVYRKPEHKDLYFIAFNDNLCFRNSCFTCRYAQSNRCSDLTIGDFWGLGKSEPFRYQTNGNVSVILVNSAKGEEFLAECNSDMNLVERSLTEAVAGNHNLQRPSIAPNADKFHRLYTQVSLTKALKRCTRKRRLKGLVLPLAKWMLSKI